MLQRPQANEFDSYFTKYVYNVGDKNINQFLRDQEQNIVHFYNTLSETEAEHRYKSGKWSAKETLGHINDSERIMSYWLLSVARGDQTDLPGYDQEGYVNHGDFNKSEVAALIADFQRARQSTLSLLDSIPPAAWVRTGVVVHKRVTARTILYIIAGHTEHHMNIIKHYGIRSE
ncbi:DinB family protein [Paenibacillus silvae]|uniref:DinB family protein n=1 Tax=Paenibacillus silvae TaxID=1325358 RepID=UPI003CE72E2D